MKKTLLLLIWGGYLFLTSPKLVLAQCAVGGCGGGTCTALGCIPHDRTLFVTWILSRALGLGGGIAFLLMISGAVQILTSAGNPEGIKNGTQTIFSAVQGLLFVVLSLFLLNLIGVEILHIPGFT